MILLKRLRRNDPFEEGRSASSRSLWWTTCPYPAGSADRARWLEGWNDAPYASGAKIGYESHDRDKFHQRFVHLLPGHADLCIEMIWLAMKWPPQDGKRDSYYMYWVMNHLMPPLVRFHHAYHAYFGIEMSLETLEATFDPSEMKELGQWIARAQQEGVLADELAGLAQPFAEFFGLEPAAVFGGDLPFPESLPTKCSPREHYAFGMMRLWKGLQGGLEERMTVQQWERESMQKKNTAEAG